MTQNVAGPQQDGQLVEGEAEEPEFKGDYSQLGFRDLQRLCKAREILADGRAPDLIEKLREYDRTHDREVDLTVPDVDLDDEREEPDLLNLDEPPAGAPDGGEVASAPPSGPGTPAPEQPSLAGQGAPGGVLTPGTPAVPIVPETPGRRHEQRDLATRTGPVANPDGAITAYRVEHPVGRRELIDADHFDMIASTHALAAAAGYATRGAPTIGTRVGFAADANGQRTAIYEVSVRRQR